MRSLFVLTVALALSACPKKEETSTVTVEPSSTVVTLHQEDVVASTPTVTEASSVIVEPAPTPVTETPVAPTVSK